jgi:hypothetical protein
MWTTTPSRQQRSAQAAHSPSALVDLHVRGRKVDEVSRMSEVWTNAQSSRFANECVDILLRMARVPPSLWREQEDLHTFDAEGLSALDRLG